MTDAGVCYVYTADLALLEVRTVQLAWAPSELRFLKALPLRVLQQEQSSVEPMECREKKAVLVHAERAPAGHWTAIYRMEV